MARRKRHQTSTSNSLPVFLRDSTSTTGAGLGGITHATSGLVLEYRREGQSSWQTVTPLVAKTLGTYVSGGIVADGSVTGAYEVDFPNAAFQAGANWVVLRIRGAANLVEWMEEFELDQPDGFSALSIDAGKVLLQPAQPNVVIPQVTTVASLVALQSAAVDSISAGVWNYTAGSGRQLTQFGFQVIVGGYGVGLAPPTVSEIADGVLLENVHDHRNTANSLAWYIDKIRKANYVTEGTVAAGLTPTTKVFRTNLTGVDDAYNHQTLLFLSGTLTGESKPIDDYSQANGLVTLEEDTTAAPGIGDEFVILPQHVHTILGIADGVLGRATSTSNYDSGDVGYVLRQLFSMIESDGGSGWEWTAASLTNSPAGGGGGSGTGANTVTVTVLLAGSPVEGAKVRLTKAAESYLGTTNASGQVVFNVDNGSWIVAITSPNTTFAGAVLAVTGNQSASYTVTAISITPSAPGNVTGYWLVLGANGLPESGAVLSMQAVSVECGNPGLALDTAVRTATSDGAGVAQFANLTPGVRYQAWRGNGAKLYISIPLDASGSLELSSLLGSP